MTHSLVIFIAQQLPHYYIEKRKQQRHTLRICSTLHFPGSKYETVRGLDFAPQRRALQFYGVIKTLFLIHFPRYGGKQKNAALNWGRKIAKPPFANCNYGLEYLFSQKALKLAAFRESGLNITRNI